MRYSFPAPLAQLVEHRTLNPTVVGSSPTRRMRKTPQKRGFLLGLRGIRTPNAFGHTGVTGWNWRSFGVAVLGA